MFFTQFTVKTRTNSDRKVTTLRQAITRTLKDAPSVAFFDPACDPRHLAVLAAHA